ncbi:homoserine dehydrogenase [Virgibacillus sp. MSJ-26]|uniref:homoserine dehydrogenase n=1 Tax=Virgibacillus sp. MSJ-26 TaxID=2841522 RepID=UPI001C11ECE6|nr:homoserine dehydrogenase [Virgibacillus sp. MSJ-26]MBU5466005.1 homoserine dehydrogenase [Virgibacillus sp. MSJ-26]
MKKLNIALLGFGTVGKGIFKTIETHQKHLMQVLGKPVDITKIVVKNIDKHSDLKRKRQLTTNFQEVLSHPDINVVFEAIVGVEPAFSYAKAALQSGKHVITANKEMFAHHGKELKTIAKENNVKIGFEATTGGGIPIIQTIEQLLQVNQINKVTAILNGTSNYILSEMREKKLTFTSVLAEAQALGYAEADPTNDIEAIDAFYKLMILSDHIYGKQPHWHFVKRQGIQQITKEQISELQKQHRRIKSIGTLELVNGQIEARVEPMIIDERHPLFAIEGVDNAITIEGSIVGELTLLGPGAGAFPTASAMIEDLSTILTSQQTQLTKQVEKVLD